MPQALLLGNCQVHPLSFYLSYYLPDWTWHAYTVYNLSESGYQQISELLAKQNIVVLTQCLYDARYASLRTEELRKNHKNLYTITNFYFNGLFPDIIYAYGKNGLIPGAAGVDYNSRLLISYFMSGCSEAEALALYNEKAFLDEHYETYYRNAETELLIRENNVDIKFASVFLDYLRSGQMMYTVNHPSSFIMSEYAFVIAKHLIDRDISPFPSKYLCKSLSEHFNAIYPWVADWLKLQYPYVHCNILFNKIYSLSEYIFSSFEQYRKQFANLYSHVLAGDSNYAYKTYIAYLTRLYSLVKNAEPCMEDYFRHFNFLKKQGFSRKAYEKLICLVVAEQ